MIIKSLLAAGLFAAYAGAAAAAPVFFDDFESYSLGTPSSLTPIWTVNPGTIDVIGAGNGFNWWGPGKYIDLNGTPDSAAKISASVGGLNIGSMYNLAFNYGYNKNSGPDESLFFGAGAATGSLGVTDFSALTGSTFGSFVLTFQATATTMSIFFQDIDSPSDGDWGGPVIDNVSVAAVPVPASLSLLIAGLGGLALIRRRRRT